MKLNWGETVYMSHYLQGKVLKVVCIILELHVNHVGGEIQKNILSILWARNIVR